MEYKSGAFQMRTDAAFLRVVDDWRRAQPDIPARAEAIRRLVRIGIECSGQSAREASGGGEFGDHPAAGQ